MREHVVAASKAMRNGDWRKASNYIINEKMNGKVRPSLRSTGLNSLSGVGPVLRRRLCASDADQEDPRGKSPHLPLHLQQHLRQHLHREYNRRKKIFKSRQLHAWLFPGLTPVVCPL